MSYVIDLTEEPHILYPHTLDLTGSHVIFNGTIINLDTVLMVLNDQGTFAEKGGSRHKGQKGQKNAALRDKYRLDKIIEQENDAKCLHNSQLARDKHKAADIDIYHNCEKSDQDLIHLKKDVKYDRYQCPQLYVYREPTYDCEGILRYSLARLSCVVYFFS